MNKSTQGIYLTQNNKRINERILKKIGEKFREFSAYHEVDLTNNQDCPIAAKKLSDYGMRNCEGGGNIWYR